MDRLHFRRQFLLAPRDDLALPAWTRLALGTHTLYAHPDLGVTRADAAGRRVVLLGYLFDAAHPAHGNDEVLATLNGETSFIDFARAADALAGTAVLLWQDGAGIRLLHDAGGLREVYFTTDPADAWAASQPALLQRFRRLDETLPPQAQAFYRSEAFVRAGRLGAADRTVFADVHHLRPNYYLDLSTARAIRYAPAKALETRPAEAVADAVAQTLRGFLDAAAQRYTLSLPLTAGWDSRVLLAAARPHRDALACFVIDHRQRSKRVDVRIARRLARRLGLSLDVVTYGDAVPPAVRAAYEASLTQGRAALLPEWYHVFGRWHPAEMFVSGNVSEVARGYYERSTPLTPEALARLTFGTADPYLAGLYEAWLAEALPLCRRHGYHPLDLFYWEERLGNWAAQAWSELHLFTETFSPYNSRALLRRLLSVDPAYRDKHDHALYRMIIRRLWPEALAEPFNPRLKLRVIRAMKRLGFYPAYQALRHALVPKR